MIATNIISGPIMTTYHMLQSFTQVFVFFQDILLIAEDILHFREKIENCQKSYAASKITSVAFRNLKAVQAKYNFAEKGMIDCYIKLQRD